MRLPATETEDEPAETPDGGRQEKGLTVNGKKPPVSLPEDPGPPVRTSETTSLVSASGHPRRPPGTRRTAVPRTGRLDHDQSVVLSLP